MVKGGQGGSLAPVACLDCTNDTICPIVKTCPTVSMWRDLGKVTSSYLDSKTLADIATGIEGAGPTQE